MSNRKLAFAVLMIIISIATAGTVGASSPGQGGYATIRHSMADVASLQPLDGTAKATITFNPRITHPVVVGQDRDRRGADIYVTAISCPEEYTFWEIRFIRVFCCGRVILIPILQRTTIYVPDPIDMRPGRWSFDARLSDESRQWISGELSRRHPGAKIVHPYWDLSRTRHFRILQSGYIHGMCYKVVMEATRVPFADPGTYVVEASFVTRGTHFTPPPGHLIIFYPPRLSTPPKHFSDKKNLHVWMLDESLVK